MTTFSIKLLAITFMVIDHIGVVFFPDEIMYRIIGRLGFPLFAWLAANGAIHTKNLNRYILRVLLFALLAQAPYVLAVREVYPNFWDLNALFTLALGLVAIGLIRRFPHRGARFLLIAAVAGVASLLSVDYGAVGVLSVIFFYLFFNDFNKMLLAQATIYIVPFYLPIYIGFLQGISIIPDAVNLAEPFALVSLLFIMHYHGKQGKKLKYLFYALYPLHLLVLFLIKRFFF